MTRSRLSSPRALAPVVLLFVCLSFMVDGTAETGAPGRRIFKDKNCASCHQALGQGGCLGPPLDGVASRRSREFILCRITDSTGARRRFSRLNGAAELMAHPRISPGAASQVVSFLSTLKTPASSYVIAGHPAGAKPSSRPAGERPAGGRAAGERAAGRRAGDSIHDGKRLFCDLGCAACHAIGDVGGQFAPRLDGVGQRLSADSIESYILSGQLQVPASAERNPRFMMPPANVSPVDAKKIAAFLRSLPRRR